MPLQLLGGNFTGGNLNRNRKQISARIKSRGYPQIAATAGYNEATCSSTEKQPIELDKQQLLDY